MKDQTYVKLAYMTGILPIKKYGSHSALNMFDEYSMTDPAELAEYVGFTETEVQQLCQQYGIDFEETQNWYDGYRFDDLHIYSPKSVVDCIRRKKFGSYWTNTETYEALRIYIDMNYGLKDTIIKQYVKALDEYTGNILLVGITYNKDTKKHLCFIEAENKTM